MTTQSQPLRQSPSRHLHRFSLSYFPDAIHGYLDERYADEYGKQFQCDIYIPSIDVFIECQYHQSHGFSQYQEGNEDENNKNIEYIKTAGFDTDTFLIRDPKKREVAKKNNLRYYELWNKSHIYNIHKLMEELKEKYIENN